MFTPKKYHLIHFVRRYKRFNIKAIVNINSSSATYIKRPSLTPIYLANNISISSAILDSRPATILLSSFLIVLSSVIS